MIRIFLGKPGGGKSFGALKDIVDEIVNGTRFICTNLSIDPGRLNEWVQKNYPEVSFDPCTRLRLLTESEAKRFWLYRRPNIDLPAPSKQDENNGKFFTVPPEAMGVLYVIDEAHIHFDARSWADSGLSLTYYNSQHRKFGDEVIFVTQFLDLLDKRVRGFAQDYVYFVNNGLQRFATYFRLPSYFTVKTYNNPQPANAKLADTAAVVTRYQMDFSLAACYDTSAGVGISGRKKPEEKRIKGLAIYWVAVPVIAGACALYFAPNVVTGAINRAVAGSPSIRADSAKKNEQDRPPAPKAGPVAAVEPVKTPAVASAPPVQPEGTFVVSVAVKSKGNAIVALSDGRVLTRSTGLVRITEEYVYTSDGHRYSRRRGKTAAQAAGGR